jgi:hypothetical protein
LTIKFGFGIYGRGWAAVTMGNGNETKWDDQGLKWGLSHFVSSISKWEFLVVIPHLNEIGPPIVYVHFNTFHMYYWSIWSSLHDITGQYGLLYTILLVNMVFFTRYYWSVSIQYNIHYWSYIHSK